MTAMNIGEDGQFIEQRGYKTRVVFNLGSNMALFTFREIEIILGYGVPNTYDNILLHGLRERILSSQKNKVLIVLHTSTSHGPNYADKYPKEFEMYKPVARNVEEGEKNVGTLVNAYDNSILYTDYLLDSLIKTLRGMSDWKRI